MSDYPQPANVTPEEMQKLAAQPAGQAVMGDDEILSIVSAFSLDMGEVYEFTERQVLQCGRALIGASQGPTGLLGEPTYYVAHPDGTFSVANPQPKVHPHSPVASQPSTGAQGEASFWASANDAVITDAVKKRLLADANHGPAFARAREVAERYSRPLYDRPQGCGDIFEWLDTELSAIDPWYRGSPSYEHDANWLKEKVLKLVDQARAIFAAPAAIDVRNAVLPTAEEFSANNKMAVTKDWMMGWNACRSSIAMPASNVRPWGYHLYGSGPEKGYTITYADRLHNNEEIAYIGDGEIAREAVTAICNAHNTSLQSPPQTGKESQS